MTTFGDRAPAPQPFPERVAVNGWTGGPHTPTSPVENRTQNWGLRRHLEEPPRHLLAEEPLDRRRWQSPQIGWALVLPEREDLPAAERATAADAPEPIRELVRARGDAPVFRYRDDLQNRFIRRYFPDGSHQDVAISSASARGIGMGALPHYLLIYGPPTVIPWTFQYILNQPCFVGRLDLDGKALENYVNALIHGWPDAACDPHSPVVWSVDLGGGDITQLMRRAIAEPVAEKLAADSDIGAGLTLLAGADATRARMAQALAEQQPALVVSTSHGMTGPLSDPVRMAVQLGIPVDAGHDLLDAETLLARWQPDGAIWYAHACCSAGSDERNSYKGLVPAGSAVDLMLDGVAALGEQIAPLPRALLGAAKPLRAFVGHVEPTFDWTLRQPETGQFLTLPIVQALYNGLHRLEPEPIGMAVAPCYAPVGELMAQWRDLTNDFTHVDAADRNRIRLMTASAQLAALDRRSMVILGDPTVAPPSLAG